MKIAHTLLRSVGYFLLTGVLLCSVGCSSFNRDWKRAQTIPTPSDDLTGRWDGTWVSERNGHSGKLRALVEKKPNEIYRARFHATFWRIFSYSYAIPLKAFQDGSKFTFEGSADLGWLAGGEYKAHGTATATNFHAIYSSKNDHGTFKLGRPGATGGK